MEIRVKFLGEPEIYIDGRRQLIPQTKILALFLFLLFHGSSTRETIISSLWYDNAPEDAKRSLRNGLYKLRSLVGKQVITTAGNTCVSINPRIHVVKDTDIFATENSEVLLLEADEFIFMDKFYLARCPAFEEWQCAMRAIYEKMLRERLESGMKKSEQTGDIELMERFAQKLLRVEPYYEPAVRGLMWLYLQKNLYHKAILIYKSFEAHMQADLGEQPEEELQLLYYRALGLDAKRLGDAGGKAVADSEPGWRKPLCEEYRKYMAGGLYRSCVLIGATGAGKASAIDAFLKEARVREPIELTCGPVESGIGFWAADTLARLLSKRSLTNYPPPGETPTRAIDYIRILKRQLERIGRAGGKPVLILRRMEYIDAESLPIILNTLFGDGSETLFTVGTYAKDMRGDRLITDALRTQGHALAVELNELCEWQVRDFLHRSHPGDEEMESLLSAAIEFSQGNYMLLCDFVRYGQRDKPYAARLSEETENRLKAVWDSFSEAERRLTECLAVCENGVTAELLQSMAGLKPQELLEALDSLSVRGVVTQTTASYGLLSTIRLKQARELLYRRLSVIRRAQLHRLAGRLYEQKYSQTPKNYYVIGELKHHFSRSGLGFEKMLYTFVDLEYVLNYIDEFFPTLKTLDGTKINFYTDRGKLYTQFREYEEELGRLENQISQDQLNILKMHFKFLLGRTLNRDGKREQGIGHIRELTRLAETLGREDYRIKAYLETVYYGLKSDNVELMREYVEKLKNIPGIDGYEVEYGILFRLEGLIHIRNREYARAEECLHASIRIFDNPILRNQNFINIAAAYDYLGLVCRDQGDYSGAEQCFLKAIDLCESKGIKKSLDVFYEDLGYTVYLQRDYERAEACLEKSLQLYDEFGTYWLRSIAESCLAIINLNKGNRSKAMEHYRRANIFASMESVKEEMHVLEQARARFQQMKVF